MELKINIDDEVKCMKKSDLVAGKHVVQYRDGCFRFVGHSNELLDSDGVYVDALGFYNERLDDVDGDKEMDIVAVYELNEVWKREEPTMTITEDEKAILRDLPGKYEWIARDKDGRLCVYPGKPSKAVTAWGSTLGHMFFDLYNHLFQMIRWEDDEPWKIEDLLKLEVKKDG